MSAPFRTPVAAATFQVKFREKSLRDETRPPEKPVDRVPRVANLLALAHRVDGMIRSGELKNWAEAAGLLRITKARIAQIAGLLLLAPAIQETVSSMTEARSDNRLNEHDLRRVVSSSSWREQLLIVGRLLDNKLRKVLPRDSHLPTMDLRSRRH